MPWGWGWTLIILAAGLGDLAVRLITDFDMTLVVRAEAVLFLVTGLVLWLLRRRSGARARWARALQWGLVALFVLTGLRAALWAGGARRHTRQYRHRDRGPAVGSAGGAALVPSRRRGLTGASSGLFADQAARTNERWTRALPRSPF
jgi:hypothetical protein